MGNTMLPYAATARWQVYTMTPDPDLYDEAGEPIDDMDCAEWSIGFAVAYVDSPDRGKFYAGVASGLADGLTWGVANHIVDLHNATLDG